MHALHASKKQDIKHLGLRISSELWEQITDAAWGMKLSRQAFCVRAIERLLGVVGKQTASGDVNGKSVRSKLPELRSKSKSQGE